MGRCALWLLELWGGVHCDFWNYGEVCTVTFGIMGWCALWLLELWGGAHCDFWNMGRCALWLLELWGGVHCDFWNYGEVCTVTFGIMGWYALWLLELWGGRHCDLELWGGVHCDFSISERCLGAFLTNSEKRLLNSSCPSVPVYQPAPNERIFFKFGIEGLLRILVNGFHISLNCQQLYQPVYMET